MIALGVVAGEIGMQPRVKGQDLDCFNAEPLVGRAGQVEVVKL